MEKYLQEIFTGALQKIGAPEDTVLKFEVPQNTTFGDLSTNVAMTLAKPLKRSPRDLANDLLASLQYDAQIDTVEVVTRNAIATLDWLAVPNPFLDQVSVRFNAPHAGFVRIELFDALGRSVSEKIERQIEKGTTSFTYPTDDVEAGSYLLRVEFDGWQVADSITRKIDRRVSLQAATALVFYGLCAITIDRDIICACVKPFVLHNDDAGSPLAFVIAGAIDR